MNVVIYDYDIIYRNHIKSIVETAYSKHLINNVSILTFESTTEVVDYIENNITRTIYFLEVCFKSMAGLLLAKQIRKKDLLSYIIFISHVNMAMLIFRFRIYAMDYIIKLSDDFDSRIEACLLLAQKTQESNKNENTFTINDGMEIRIIKKDEIILIEKVLNTHKVIIYCRNENGENYQWVFYENLNKIEQHLGIDFLRCHKSYIISKNHIKSINKKMRTIEMCNGTTCYYSRNYAKGLLKFVSNLLPQKCNEKQENNLGFLENYLR